MDKYVCDLCGWIYDPQKGVPEKQIASGITFDDLPENFVCPVCGANKEHFVKI